METYIDILDLLMKTKKEKKKKEPNLKEKEAFRNAWIGLVSESGFCGYAEQYLYEGFSFCGAEPFYAYLVQTKDKNATLTTLFSGKFYGNDSNVTFRLITHLLALMLNDNVTGNVLAPIIKRLPGACINKDKKQLGTAEKTIEKYLLAELTPTAVLVPLSSIETKPVFIKEFITLVSAALDSIESSGATKDSVTANMGKLRKWFSDYEANPSIFTNKEMSQVELAPVMTENKPNIYEENSSQGENLKKSDVTAEKTPADTVSYLIELLGNAGKAATTIQSVNIQQKIKIDTLTHAVKAEQEKLRLANQQIVEQQDTIKSLCQRLSASEGDVVTLGQELAKKDVVIAEKDAEIAERIKMTDVLSRDRSKQADETIQRLASKIRIEYRDFVDALDIPMTCDLGENLRLQLQSIFDILEKGGMKMK